MLRLVSVMYLSTSEPETVRMVPFNKINELYDGSSSLNDAEYLPGYPQVGLHDTTSLYNFLSQDLCTPDLETMAPHLWWMTKQSSTHIASLHHQAVKLRRIVVTENPELHLVWYYDLIFIKPLPRYLLSHSFWTTYLTNPSSKLISAAERRLLERSALGFLRTYWYLVRYESDFNIAKETRLIPETATWESFSAFSSNFNNILDEDVTERYHYGQIRLSRLNFYSKFFLGRRYFHKVIGQYDTYFSKLYGPLLFIFGVVSVLLNALQVEMATEQFMNPQWPAFWKFSRCLGTFFVAFVLLVLLFLILLFLSNFATEWFYALRDRRRRIWRKEEKMSSRLEIV